MAGGERTQTLFDDHLTHRARRVYERAKLVAFQSIDYVLGRDARLPQRLPRRMAEYQAATGMVGGRTQQAPVIGVAAHYAMQDHDVGRFDIAGARRNVEHAPLDSAGESMVVKKLTSGRLVRRRKLQIDRSLRTSSKQFDVNSADSAAYFEDRRVAHAELCRQVDDAPRGSPWSVGAVSIRHAPCHSGIEYFFVAACAAAVHHTATMALIARLRSRPGGMANGFDVVAVGIAYKGAVITGVVFGPQSRFVQDGGVAGDRRGEELVDCAGRVRREREVGFAKTVAGVSRTKPEIRLRPDAEPDDLAEIHDSVRTQRGKNGVVERGARSDIGTLDRHVINHAAIMPSFTLARQCPMARGFPRWARVT